MEKSYKLAKTRQEYLNNMSVRSGKGLTSQNSSMYSHASSAISRNDYSQSIASRDQSVTSGRYHQQEESVALSRVDTQEFFERDYFNMPFDDSTSNHPRNGGGSNYSRRNDSAAYSRSDASNILDKQDWKAWETPNNA
jgi:hypothetical protein